MKYRTAIIALLLMPVLSLPGIAKEPAMLAKSSINEIISSLTLEDKANLLVGTETSVGKYNHKVVGAAGFTYAIDSLGIPSVNLADGPVGVRIHPSPSGQSYSSFCTAFPSTTLLAATWNKDLVKEEGIAIGNEAHAYGVDIILTPGINLMRNPLCGRNFEYFSEDPLLSGILGASMINGIQQEGIGACVKHFVANNQQTNKLNNDPRITQRALRELYLKSFEICIRESHPWTLMGSYNKIGGKLTQTNPELLRTVLRDEWKYDGLVMTDWYKTRHTRDQIMGGTNMMMPGEKSQVEEIIAAVKNGTLYESDVDESVRNMLKLITRTVTFNGWKFAGVPDLDKNALLSRRVAAEGMVLLKNDSSVLPLAKGAKIALFGASGYMSIAGGTGSSNVNKPHIIDISDGLENAGYSLNPVLKRIYGEYRTFKTDLLTKEPDATAWEKISYFRPVIPEMDMRKANGLVEREARNSDIAVVVIGRGSGEESDRVLDGDFYLTAEEKYMLDKVCSQFHAAGKKVIVVANVCGVIETKSWKDMPDAILLAWFPGQECGNAVADVLSGDAYPSGKLPVTFPCDYADIPSSKNFPIAGKTKSGKDFDYTDYEEDIWVGYRYFTSAGVPVVYPFGYGMSYTRFNYTNPHIKKKNGRWQAEITVTNTGENKGKETVQLYVSSPQASMVKPLRELKAFAKTKELNPGESQVLVMTFSDYDIASFDEGNSQWITVKGRYGASFGASCEDIRFNIPFNISRDKVWKVNNVLKPVEKVNVLNLTVDNKDAAE